MSIKSGDRIPSSQLKLMTDDGAQALDSAEYFAGRKIVLFSVPGAFTPTCSISHLPGFIKRLDNFHEKGVDVIACISVNDVFVMDAWGKNANAEGIDMLADGNGDFATAMGLDLDARAFGMGVRAQRYALIADDGLITDLFVEAPGEFRVSAAEYVLSKL